MSNIDLILKDSDIVLTELFTQEQIDTLESSLYEKEMKSGLAFYATCLVRNKGIKITPEEVVRQLYLMKLNDEYAYPFSRMQIEYIVHFGREKKRADIVIMDNIQPTVPYIVIELKKPKLKDGKEQLKSYCNATGASMAVWTNGREIIHYHRKDPNYFEPIPNIPNAKQGLRELLQEEFTIDDLVAKDKLLTDKRDLKDIILDMEDEVLANSGVDVFEEVFKLIFTKLYDELTGTRDRKRQLEFRNSGESDNELKEKVQNLFESAMKKWHGIFDENAKLNLSSSHLAICIASLQDIKLFNSNLDVVDDAFEYLVNKSSKGEKGQYFTPRYVIDMAVKMLDPCEDESIIDTAAGSCGFPIHSAFHVWDKLDKEMGIEDSHHLTAEEKSSRHIDYVREKVFGIDFDERSVRVSRMLNLIAGDGETNVLHLNTLDYERWDEFTQNEQWQDKYFNGFRNLKKFRADKKSNKEFTFDVLLANPPFAGDIKESRILSRYEIADKNGKIQKKVGRDILFIERNLDFLRPGGRMAVVLPQGRFNNSTDKYIRDFIRERCRILGVVGLHGNVFKPHTGTKTSVFLVQKWDEKDCPRQDDYNIFFATMREPSKENNGTKIYAAEDGKFLLDNHNHRFIKHDLYNHNGMTQDGIAEAFNFFAQKEGLSFASKKP